MAPPSPVSPSTRPRGGAPGRAPEPPRPAGTCRGRPLAARPPAAHRQYGGGTRLGRQPQGPERGAPEAETPQRGEARAQGRGTPPRGVVGDVVRGREGAAAARA